MSRFPAIIAYDIVCNKRRRQVHKSLIRWRISSQKSVHECLLNRQEAQALFIELGEKIDPATDRLLLAWLNNDRHIYTQGAQGARIDFNQPHHVH
ncbi:CRISPR-associated endonuclease Cas2 [Thiomicrospira microaerophila]|uniref:CRISPR-associated endonuclease Cas2 n=1 Tax=Thiomicrospira microaerophila TaxID=406020 RepID=UPI0005CB172F|nr:CRISPR-associated endonuclease Cas2 [Thiomicrospira microaerophila]